MRVVVEAAASARALDYFSKQDKADLSDAALTQRSKALTSSVQRLRGWVGSDPSRRPELGDALVELHQTSPYLLA